MNSAALPPPSESNNTTIKNTDRNSVFQANKSIGQGSRMSLINEPKPIGPGSFASGSLAQGIIAKHY